MTLRILGFTGKTRTPCFQYYSKRISQLILAADRADFDTSATWFYITLHDKFFY